MGYRDALIGGALVTTALRGRDTRRWFLASGGADASDLLGGLAVHDQMSRSQQLIGLGGAVVGIGVGIWGAVRPRGLDTLAGARYSTTDPSSVVE